MSSLQNRSSERLFDGLLARSRAVQTRSYTSLGGGMAHRLATNDNDTEEFKYDLDSSEADSDLKGGRRVGIFLHEAIEKLDFASFEGADLSSWRAQKEIGDLFNDLMRRHQVNDVRWFERGTEIVFNALTSRIVISSGTTVGPLSECRSVREMEFVYPLPERTHALLESAGDGQWTVERGYLKGFVDFVFQDDGKYYFADWKSDFLPSYERSAIEAHVNEYYALQAKIYSVGVVRLLGIRSEKEYEERFGGLSYLFLRGMQRDGDGTEGVYFRRPPWDEICLYERALIEAIPESRTLG
jgi:exodeoxyribonuclease V beta subunit